ncbi:MAG TPA: CDP-diacylglycerol--glycerol-3-phosphate 3-phosphatidyltransferase [Candidatus Babeliales bacterium]|nr:CDP-diacylglycerol--glycerol-3-phosphate 3-phosphatidyltransferase [Candidatus Babeliales bacterium]
MFNASLGLTYFRFFASIFVLPYIICFVSQFGFFGNIFALIFFIILCLTDFFDGYLARAYHLQTVLGALLDPIADKVLLLSALVSLVSVGKANVFIAILFLSREFFVMGLRLLASSNNQRIAVSSIARYKTAFQMIYIGFAIFNPNNKIDIFTNSSFLALSLSSLEFIFLIVALILSLWSALLYFYQSLDYILELK